MYNLSQIAEQLVHTLRTTPRTTAGQLAQALGVERHTLNRAARAYCGLSVREMRLKCQAEWIRAFLSEHPNCSIKEAAATLGYSAAAFAALTRRLLGSPPTQLRVRHRISSNSSTLTPEPDRIETSSPTLRGVKRVRPRHTGAVVWLTGLPGSGKTTISLGVRRVLCRHGEPVIVLDGDAIRNGLSSDLGFSMADRAENMRRVGEVVGLLVGSGIIVIAAFVSPRESDRAIVRQRVTQGRFFEVYIKAPLEVCERRDPKGLYAKARMGAVEQFTGVSSPYEPPIQPDLELATDALSIDEAVAVVVSFVRAQLSV